MYKILENISSRDLLEHIYVMQLQILNKLNKMDDDGKEFALNLLADLIGSKIIERQDSVRFDSNGTTTRS